MALAYLFDPNKQFQDLNGVNNVAGFLRVYYEGTDDRATTYKNFIGTMNPADIPIDNYGRAVVIVEDEKTYRLEVYASNGNLMWTQHPLCALVGGGGSFDQVQSNWAEDDPTSAAFIKNKPDLSEVATSGDYNDLSNKPTSSTASPSMDGIASAGSSTQWSRGDHVHPTDTSREAAANKTTTVRQNGQADNTKFPTEAAVRTAIDSAVSSAYHAAGTKTVAQLTGSLLVSANEGDVYNITDSGVTTSDFIEGAGLPIRVGDNVVVCDVGGGVYKFDLLSGFVDLTNYLTKTGDGSDVTASFTAASTRTNVTTGEKLSVLFGKVAKWFSDLKALAFKDKVDTVDIEDDAVTADKVKDNETLPVNVTGYASNLRQAKCKFLGSETGYRLMAELPPSTSNYADTCYIFNIYETRDQSELTSGILKGVLSIRIRRDNALYRYSSAYKGSSIDYINLDLRVDSSTHGVKLYAAKSSGAFFVFTVFELLTCYDQYNSSLNPTLHTDSELLGSVSGTVVTPTFTLLKGSGGTIPLADNSGVGSTLVPVYVSSAGEVLPCTIKGIYFSKYNEDSLSNILDAFGAGLLVFSKYAGDVYLLLDADSNGARFVCNTTADGKTYYSTLTVNSSDTWSHTSENIFNNIAVRQHYGANHEASVTTTATDISNGYVEYALDFTDMIFGGGNSILFISLPNESALAYHFTRIDVMTYPYNTGYSSIDICKFTDLTHDDNGNAIGANDEYTWIRTCNSPNYGQRIKGIKLRAYLNMTSGLPWDAGIELKLKIDFNAVRFDKL